MKHLAGELRQSTCLSTDECQGCPDSRLQKVKFIYASVKISNTSVLTVCFKLIKFVMYET
jgi:hypothetical protein